MSKEIIELLEDAIIHVSMIRANFMKKDLVICRADILSRSGHKGILDQALALLKQPKCKTCGDTGHKHILDKKYKSAEYAPPEAITTIPCPDCQQPAAGKFTKALRSFKS